MIDASLNKSPYYIRYGDTLTDVVVSLDYISQEPFVLPEDTVINVYIKPEKSDNIVKVIGRYVDYNHIAFNFTNQIYDLVENLTQRFEIEIVFLDNNNISIAPSDRNLEIVVNRGTK